MYFNHATNGAERLWIAGCLSIPVVALAVAYAWLAVDHGKLNLWPVVVHESGKYTLGGTVLYFRHFLREIPTVFVMALFVVAATPAPVVTGVARPESHRMLVLALIGLLGAAAIAAGAFVADARDEGVHEAVRNLSQLYTRDDLPAYGSHWQFHLLSTIWFGAAASVVAWIGGRYFGAPATDATASRQLHRVAWLVFLLITVTFGIGLSPFTDPRFLGHQAREIMTHAVTSLPLALGLVAAVIQASGLGRASAAAPLPHLTLRVLVVLVPVYLAIGVLTQDAMSAGQTDRGLSAMVAAHFLEHTLDYVVISGLVVGMQAARIHIALVQADATGADAG